ncbi:MAG: hypothetical protein IPN18_18290 [Ignavibacteriales bacterium]|nr:hypothetical protein [Ignavibacteriales bacterium]
MVRKDPKFSRYISGIDAASNELVTPPEVFGPAYRYLRKNGINHFTYHVGEDFVHLLSGLRSIFEAVEFLDLRQGDRIGHGTASAIDAALWSRMVGDELYIKKGEWLDNLIFLHYFIMSRLKCLIYQDCWILLDLRSRNSAKRFTVKTIPQMNTQTHG